MHDNPPFDPPYITHAEAIDYGGQAPELSSSRAGRVTSRAGSSTPARGSGNVAMILNVPFAQKDQAKRLGARWDAARRAWYVPQGVDTAPFKQWWPEG